MRKTWMGAAIGAWLPHTVGLVITKTFQGPEKWQLCRLLALRRTCGWTEGPEQLSLISQYTMQISTYSALSGMNRTMTVFKLHTVGCRLGVFFWLLCFEDMGRRMFCIKETDNWSGMPPCQRSGTPHGSCTHHLEAVLTFLMLQWLGCSLQATFLASWLIEVNMWIYNISFQTDETGARWRQVSLPLLSHCSWNALGFRQNWVQSGLYLLFCVVSSLNHMWAFACFNYLNNYVNKTVYLLVVLFISTA